jgi:hypothetical protein
MDEVAEAFRDWHAGKRRADWSARWRTWVREAVKRANGQGHGRGRGAAPATVKPPWPVRGFGGVHNTDEPWADYVARMRREGKLPAEPAADTAVH